MSETAHAQFSREASCRYCGRKLNLGYHFMCHVCGSAYCYVHRTRHDRAHISGSLLDQVYAK